MELVVVNRSNAIARGIVSRLLGKGGFSKVRLLDYRPYRKSVYCHGREHYLLMLRRGSSRL
jgi:hypothetical protein